MKGPRATRALAAVFVLALVVPVIAGCHKPKPKFNGASIDQVYGHYVNSEGSPIGRPQSRAQFSGMGGQDLDIGERCRLEYYLVIDSAQAYEVGTGVYFNFSSDNYRDVRIEGWPFDPMPGSYRI